MDPVIYQVILSRLNGIVQEMTDAVFRTGYSTIVRESNDASCTLVDLDGNAVSEFVGLPLHVPCITAIVRAIRRDFGDEIAPGDAFITNHPYYAQVPHSIGAWKSSRSSRLSAPGRAAIPFSSERTPIAKRRHLPHLAHQREGGGPAFGAPDGGGRTPSGRGRARHGGREDATRSRTQTSDCPFFCRFLRASKVNI